MLHCIYSTWSLGLYDWDIQYWAGDGSAHQRGRGGGRVVMPTWGWSLDCGRYISIYDLSPHGQWAAMIVHVWHNCLPTR